MKIPTFEELPIRKDLPAESSWGVFGDNDALGCLNFLVRSSFSVIDIGNFQKLIPGILACKQAQPVPLGR